MNSALQAFMADPAMGFWKKMETLTGLGVKVKRHPRLPLLQFEYNMVEARGHFDNPIVTESRGIILSDSPSYPIVARPFDKFYNQGESRVPDLVPPLTFEEKLDGTLAIYYHYGGQWHWATRGSPDASGECLDPLGRSYVAKTFAQLFDEAATTFRHMDPPHNLTFLFEYTGPWNRIIVQYDEPRLTLLAARYNDTGEYARNYMLADLAMAFAVPRPKVFPYTRLDQIDQAWVNTEPTRFEGFVVRDVLNNRVKLKHPGYVALHALRGRTSPKSFLELVRTGESNEVIAAIPALAEEAAALQEEYDSMCETLAVLYEQILLGFPSWPDKKEFALAVKDLWCAPVLFGMYNRDGREKDGIQVGSRGSSAFEVLKASSIQLVERMLAIYRKEVSGCTVNSPA